MATENAGQKSTNPKDSCNTARHRNGSHHRKNAVGEPRPEDKKNGEIRSHPQTWRTQENPQFVPREKTPPAQTNRATIHQRTQRTVRKTTALPSPLSSSLAPTPPVVVAPPPLMPFPQCAAPDRFEITTDRHPVPTTSFPGGPSPWMPNSGQRV